MLSQISDSEVAKGCGRMDAVVKTKKSIYVIEMKYDKSAEEALLQIDDRDYTLAYRSDPRRLVKVGLNIDKEKRTFGDWII